MISIKTTEISVTFVYAYNENSGYHQFDTSPLYMYCQGNIRAWNTERIYLQMQIFVDCNCRWYEFINFGSMEIAIKSLQHVWFDKLHFGNCMPNEKKKSSFQAKRCLSLLPAEIKQILVCFNMTEIWSGTKLFISVLTLMWNSSVL